MRSASRCRERVGYSLRQKGARVVTGRNLDDDGSQSNASGKSSLVMAPLWALTGRSDARAEVGCVCRCVVLQPCSRHSLQLTSAWIPCTWTKLRACAWLHNGHCQIYTQVQCPDTSPGHGTQSTE